MNTGWRSGRRRSISVRSSGFTPARPSRTATTTSASSAASSAWARTARPSSAPSSASKPPVSTTRKRRPPMSATPMLRSRVTPGSGATRARRERVRRLKSVDLPVLGRPTSATTGSCCSASARGSGASMLRCGGPGRTRGGRGADASTATASAGGAAAGRGARRAGPSPGRAARARPRAGRGGALAPLRGRAVALLRAWPAAPLRGGALPPLPLWGGRARLARGGVRDRPAMRFRDRTRAGARRVWSSRPGRARTARERRAGRAAPRCRRAPSGRCA